MALRGAPKTLPAYSKRGGFSVFLVAAAVVVLAVLLCAPQGWAGYI